MWRMLSTRRETVCTEWMRGSKGVMPQAAVHVIAGVVSFPGPSRRVGLTACIFSFTVIDIVDAVADSIVPHLISMSRMVNTAPSGSCH